MIDKKIANSPDYFLFEVYNKMHPVHLADMSKAVMSKLRNGHSVRAALAAKGSGVPAFLSEDNIKKLMKAGKKGGKAVIRLGTEELHRNRSEGSGIMAGGKLKMGGFKDFSSGFKKGFNAMGGVDGLVGGAEMMAGAGISAGPSARAGKLKGFKGNPVKDVKNLAKGKAVRACGEGFLKDMGHSFIHTTNQLGTPIISDYTKHMEGSGISAGPAARGGAVRASQVQAIAKKIASEAAKKVKGGKLKMKSITGAISSIAKNPTVQNLALDMAKEAMGAGLIAGGKLKMKDITKHIGSIASNPTIQKIAIDSLKGAMGGEGIFAGAHGGSLARGDPSSSIPLDLPGRAASDSWKDQMTEKMMHGRKPKGASVKRKVVDLIEDIGENRPRKRGESRVRQAIDLVETMRKPRGKGMFTGTRGGKLRVPKGARRTEAYGSGLYAGTRGGAIGPNGQLSGITNVGAGGNLMCLSNPALMPQPVSENFFFHTQFPPALASRMEG